MASDNKSLGRFHLDGIPSAPRGVPQIEVSFDLDANGILNVSALDKATNKEQSIRIEASSGLSDADIEKMKEDAKKYAQEDKEKRESIDLHNNAEQTIYQTEKQIDELGDKISDEDKKNLSDSIDKLKEANKGDDSQIINDAISAVNTTWQKISEKLYQETKESDSNTESGEKSKASTNKSNDNVEEADFEEVK